MVDLRFVVVVVFSLSQASQTVVTAQIFARGFQAPIQLTWFLMCFNIFLSIPRYLEMKKADEQEPSVKDIEENGPPPSDSDSDDDADVGACVPKWVEEWFFNYQRSYKDPTTGVKKKNPLVCGSLILTEILVVLLFFALYVSANVSYTMALKVMSAGLVSSLFATSPAFVCFLSFFILKRPLYVLEAIAVVFAVGGIVCIAQPWHAAAGGATLSGVILSLVASISAALYNVFFNLLFQNQGWKRCGLFLAKLSVVCIVLGTPLVALAVDGLEVEPTAWASGALNKPVVFIMIIASGLFGVSFNFVQGYAVTITYPLFVAIGSVLSAFPVLFMTGLITHVWPDGSQWGGIVLIFVGFGLLVANDYRLVKKSQEEKEEGTEKKTAEEGNNSAERSLLLQDEH